jgi:hypothetical protein
MDEMSDAALSGLGDAYLIRQFLSAVDLMRQLSNPLGLTGH